MNKKMVVKTATALILIAVALPPLILGGIWLRILAGVVAAIAGYEVANIQSEKAKWLTTIINAATIVAMYSFSEKYFPVLCAFYVTVSFIAVMIDEKITAEYAAYSFLIIALCGMALTCVFKLYDMTDGFVVMLYVAIATYVCDSGAYFFGVFFGKHKLIPRISPNKTIEGSIGGYASGAVVSLIFGLILVHDVPWTLLLAGSLTLPAVAQLGDLSFSSIKRHFGIKDFGSIFPEHGGVLDRVDSLIFCLMFFNGLLILWGI